MTKLIKLLFFILFPLSLFAQIEVSNSDLDYSLKKDGRDWKVGYSTENKDMSIKEYLPGDETVDNWNEMLTIHHYSGISISLDKYFEAFMRELQKMVPDTKVNYKLLNQSGNSLLGEWWIDDKSVNTQHELFKVLTGNNDVYIMRYTTKDPKPEEKLKVWQEILDNAKIVQKEKELPPLPEDKEEQMKQIQELQFGK